jgi:hypothetical protein
MWNNGMHNTASSCRTTLVVAPKKQKLFFNFPFRINFKSPNIFFFAIEKHLHTLQKSKSKFKKQRIF